MKDNLIYSQQKRGHWFAWVFGTLFAGFSLPGVITIPEEVARENWLILLVLLFPLIGIGVFWWGVAQYRAWRFFGPAPLTPDPSPGALHGDIGGTIVLDRYDAPDIPPRVTLQSVRVTYSGSGKDRRRHEKILWQADQQAYPDIQGQQTRLGFVFQAREGLPETGKSGRADHHWQLILEGQWAGRQLTRTYRIPVTTSSHSSTIQIPEAFRQQARRQDDLEALESVQQQVDVSQTPYGLRLYNAAFRNPVLYIMLMVMGLVFGGAGIGMGYWALQGESMLYLMAAIFFPAGLAMLVWGLWLAGRSLEVFIKGQDVLAIRYFLGRPLFRRQTRLTSSDQLQLVKSGSTTKNHEHVEYFRLVLEDGGNRIHLAEGIAGDDEARVFRENLIRLIGL
ncbi:hypothetical protein QQM79_07440 [Marinobacteraceae bacterium S3BR75-40.1]